jgi:dienelactone hydrolase
VGLAVLPFHGVRGNAGQRRPAFPHSDPRMTVEGFRQAVLDLRALVGFFRARGSEHVGVMGMSLGGYSTALLATVQGDLAFAVPMIPLASIAEAARAGGRFVGTEAERELQHRALEETFRVVSPLGRAPRIASERVLILAAMGDQITPIAHARKLAAHFGAPIEQFAGGHLLQVGRRDAFRAFGRHLGRLGVLKR